MQTLFSLTAYLCVTGTMRLCNIPEQEGLFADQLQHPAAVTHAMHLYQWLCIATA